MNLVFLENRVKVYMVGVEWVWVWVIRNWVKEDK